MYICVTRSRSATWFFCISVMHSIALQRQSAANTKSPPPQGKNIWLSNYQPRRMHCILYKIPPPTHFAPRHFHINIVFLGCSLFSECGWLDCLHPLSPFVRINDWLKAKTFQLLTSIGAIKVDAAVIYLMTCISRLWLLKVKGSISCWPLSG